MNDYVPQILNDDFNAFFFSDFCHQPLVLVSTVGTGCVFMLITTSGFYCSQPLEFMITSTSTMSHR